MYVSELSGIFVAPFVSEIHLPQSRMLNFDLS